MRTAKQVGPGVLAAIALACGPMAPETSRSEPETPRPEMAGGGVAEKVTGGGQFVHPVFGTVTFAFVAIRHGDGRISGRFLQNQHDLGFTYKGDVTCFAVDQVNHRAWIGGVLTQSNDPDPVTEVGDDAWFRVLDTGKSSSEPDRSTFMGFEQPPPGIVTSEEYCQLKIWPDGNLRTWPVVSGNVVIHQ
jgi:hypothetical protein